MKNINMIKCTYPSVMKDRYLISEDGDVYDTLKDKIIKPYLHHTGYYYLSLSAGLDSNGKNIWKAYQVHRLVAYQFVPNPNNYPVVDHINGDKLYNHYTNLEWVTIAENVRRASNNHLLNGACYGESKVREVCELLEQGYGSLDIYRIFMNDPYAPVSDNEKLYIFIDRIRRRQSWDSIVSEYNFDGEKCKSKGKQGFRINEDSKYSEEFIRDICSYLEQNWDPSKIYYHYFPDSNDLHDHWDIYNLIQGLRRRENWDYITKDYKYTMESTTARKRITDTMAYKYFCEGYTLKEVRRLLGINSIKENPKEYGIVLRAHEKYKEMKKLKRNQIVKVQIQE